MSKILHLSDLHLGPPEDTQLLDDHKSPLAGGDRLAQKDVLAETLKALEDGGALDDLTAVVISGDLTNRARPEGFKEFGDFIAPLLNHVEPEDILVVPGNHDVPWEPEPGDPDRYKEFLTVTRAKEMATPMLDGIDFPTAATEAHHLVAREDFILIPFNSSHFSWGKEELDPAVLDEILNGTEDLKKAVDVLRRHDVARVSNEQVEQVLALLSEKEPDLARDDDPRVRIAVLHHQLLPVSSREEFKTFESLSNLGAIRELLAQLRVDVVLHGHKHTSTVFWDYIAHQGEMNRSPWRLLTCASPGSFIPGQPAMRLIRIGSRSEARDLEIEDVIAPRRGGRLKAGRKSTARLWRSAAVDRIGDAMSIRGANVSEVYAKIQSIFDGRRADEPIHDLVCEVEDPGEAEKLPTDFPELEGIADAQLWMDDLVAWWQIHDPQLLPYVTFNHGERIYRRWGDQILRAVEALRSSLRGGTTRAVIILFDPWTDGTAKTEFPSFVLIQLQLTERDGVLALDLTGYFRKQEMRYWWPINVAELAKVQADVISRLSSGDERVTRGRLRTVSAYAAAEERLPAVALAAIDRAVDQHPEDLWQMAYGLAHGTDEGRDELKALWERYLNDLGPRPDEPSGILPTSHRGLGDVLRIVEWLGLGKTPVGVALSDLVGHYDSLQDQNPLVKAGASTVRTTNEKLEALRGALDEKLGG